MNHVCADYMNEALRHYYVGCENKPEKRLVYFRILAKEIRELYQLVFFVGDRKSVEALKPALKSLTLGNVPAPILPKNVQRPVQAAVKNTCHHQGFLL